MRLFKNKRRAALSTAPGMYAEEDPSKVIFETSTRLKLEANRWMLISFGLAFVAAGAVWTRQPPPSVTRVVGVSADVGGHPIVTELVAYKPDSQAVRTTVKDMAVRWFTIEPVLSDRLETSRMTANINSVKAQMIGAATGQFRDWLKDDAPFQAITANPEADPRSRCAQHRAARRFRPCSLNSRRRPRRLARPGKPEVKQLRADPALSDRRANR